jgi:serine/threonine protein kinase
MAAPSTNEEFLELVRKSGVIESKRLDAYLDKAQANSSLPDQPSKLAGYLVRDGILTHFQAEQFLQGRWRRFNIGKYKVLERIGSGGMGSVYLCEHKFMRRRAAVKVLPTAKASDPASLERFYREARAVAALDHPNIVRAYDIDHEDNLHFLVMEYVDGSSLQEIVKKIGPLNPIRSAHYISQAAEGLQHAHEAAGLVHRDIKPGNLLVDRSGVVKVLDMGLARFFNDEEDLLTRKYDENVLGTADYLAPEQALDSHSVDIRADIYSLGATFYYCLTGRTPFSEGTVAQKLIWHQTRQPKPIRTLQPDAPEELAAVVEKMMAKDPAHRFQTPLEVVQALAPWTQTPIDPPSEEEMPQLSLAAAGSGTAEGGPSVTSLPAPPAPPARARKGWDITNKPKPPAPKTPPPSPQVKQTRPTPVVKAPAAMAGETRAFDNLDTDPVLATRPKTRPAAKETETVPQPAAEPEDEESLPWENLSKDTKDTKEMEALSDTVPRSPKKTPVRRPPVRKAMTKAGLSRRQLWIILGIAGGLVLLILVLTLWRAFSGDDAKPAKVSRSQQGPARYIVSRNGDDRTFRTVGEALRRAVANDHIVVVDDVWEEQLTLTVMNKGITIEADPTKSVEWRYPDGAGEGKYLLFASEAAGVRLRGFTLNGRNLVEELLLISGHCPGLTLENLSVRGFKRYAVLCANAAGSRGNPITLRDVHTQTDNEKEAALAFTVNSKITSPRVNQHIVVRGCTFSGPYKAPLYLADAAAIDAVVFEKNQLQPQAGKPTIPMPAPKS